MFFSFRRASAKRNRFDFQFCVFGSAATCTQERAGASVAKNSAYAALMVWKFFKSLTKIVV